MYKHTSRRDNARRRGDTACALYTPHTHTRTPRQQRHDQRSARALCALPADRSAGRRHRRELGPLGNAATAAYPPTSDASSSKAARRHRPTPYAIHLTPLRLFWHQRTSFGRSLARSPPASPPLAHRHQHSRVDRSRSRKQLAGVLSVAVATTANVGECHTRRLHHGLNALYRRACGRRRDGWLASCNAAKGVTHAACVTEEACQRGLSMSVHYCVQASASNSSQQSAECQQRRPTRRTKYDCCDKCRRRR